MPQGHFDPWTPSQRRGLIAVLSLLIAALAIRLCFNPATVTEPQPIQGPFAADLADRIDPNTASAAELAAIPTLGEKRAQQIVEFRQQYRSTHPNSMAFTKLDDLQHIKGIGPATLETLEPYLIFPAIPSK